MTQFKRPLIGTLVFCLVTALLAARVYAADIPAYDGTSETPGMSPTARAEVPLDRPNIEVTALLPWLADTATAAYSLDADTYKDTLKKASANFTTDGWKDFTSILARNDVINQVTNKGMVVSLTTGTPILLSEGIKEDNKYQWTITMPATISYVESKDERRELTTINVTIVRVPLNDNLLGIQILNWTQT